MSFKRSLRPPNSSFFLFGPRATGKTTWLTKQANADLFINLLKSSEFLRYSKHPEELSQIIQANPSWKCIVIDEIQKVPALLDEVHSLIFEREGQVRFILSGSSARKLKKSGVNMLAGRALVRRLSPLTGLELQKDFDLQKSLSFGMLPQVWTISTEEEKIDYLYAYVETYLKEEIQQEALTRNLPAYSSFLEHMALRNSQVINLQNLSKEIGVARTTLKGYLEILEDTLLGYSLSPIQLKAKVKEVATPKFYFFDTGVIRALSNSLNENFDTIKGSLLETYILHELMAHSNYNNKHWQFNYWATPNQTEVDFIISSGQNRVGIEIKSAAHWKDKFSFGLNILLAEGKIKKALGVYTGDEIIQKGHVTVIPAAKFSMYLVENDFFSKNEE